MQLPVQVLVLSYEKRHCSFTLDSSRSSFSCYCLSLSHFDSCCSNNHYSSDCSKNHLDAYLRTVVVADFDTDNTTSFCSNCCSSRFSISLLLIFLFNRWFSTIVDSTYWCFPFDVKTLYKLLIFLLRQSSINDSLCVFLFWCWLY